MQIKRQQSLVGDYLSTWIQLGISKEMINERNLPLFGEAKELEIAEVSADGKKYLLIPEAASAWKNMKVAASRDGVEIYIVSAYRSIQRQVDLIRNKLQKGQSLEVILKVLAPPGCSEHHTGRAIDLGYGKVQPLDPEFESTPAFSWLDHHAIQYGFELSFPKGNRFGYVYEPWHWCFSETAI